MDERGFYLGAYAASATLSPWDPEVEAEFWKGVSELPQLRGLELPFYTEGPNPAPALEPLLQLRSDWDFILTTLPGTMQAMGRLPSFGLASDDEAGRRAALDAAEQARVWISHVQRFSQKPLVTAVHLHSAPRPSAGVRASAASLGRSLDELLQRDWFGARLCLEHCDAWQHDRPPAKGFLPLAQEARVVQERGLGMTLNWGRSAIETRSALGVLEHIELLEPLGLIWGFMFSGTAVDDPEYGSWLDNHAPVQLGDRSPWDPQGGILNLRELARVRERLKGKEVHWGLKIQPFPASLDLVSRLACLKAQILGITELGKEDRD